MAAPLWAESATGDEEPRKFQNIYQINLSVYIKIFKKTQTKNKDNLKWKNICISLGFLEVWEILKFHTWQEQAGCFHE